MGEVKRKDVDLKTKDTSTRGELSRERIRNKRGCRPFAKVDREHASQEVRAAFPPLDGVLNAVLDASPPLTPRWSTSLQKPQGNEGMGLIEILRQYFTHIHTFHIISSIHKKVNSISTVFSRGDLFRFQPAISIFFSVKTIRNRSPRGTGTTQHQARQMTNATCLNEYAGSSA